MKETMRQDELAAAMIEEAAERSPEFSLGLHARIMGRIPASMSKSQSEPRYKMGWRLTAAGVAAAAVLAIAVSIPLTGEHHQTNPRVARLPSLPTIDNPVVAFSEPVGNSLAEARFAYLDRDARNVMRYMAHQVDVLPENR